jgi:hypothetical protein
VKNLLLHLSTTLPDFLHKGWEGDGGIELRSATNVDLDLYNTKTFILNYSMAVVVFTQVAFIIQIWDFH